MLLNPWFTSLNYQASQLFSGDNVLPVVAKMTEFTKYKTAGWLSELFYNKEGPLQLKVVFVKRNETTYMSVSLHSEQVQPNIKHTAFKG